MYDIAIIGAGISGSAIARELSRYDLNTVILERGSEVCQGTTKANSAIVHGGYDAPPNSLKAKLNEQIPGAIFYFVYKDSNSLSSGMIHENSPIKGGKNYFTQGQAYTIWIVK